MFGGGGGGGDSSVYWGRKESDCKGIVVLCSWVSVQESHLRSYVDLYSSLGWNSLVSQADFLSAFYPERASSLSLVLLNELVEELSIRPCPVVFVAFSVGSKACLYKIFQIIQGTHERHLGLEESRLLRNCVSAQIYDSSPVDFTADLGARFALAPTILKLPGPVKLVSWVARGIASGLDGLYLTRFESQRSEYWQTLYSSVDLKIPFLILCSENDAVASFQGICHFAHRLQKLGGDVKLVKLNGSPHTGHYEHYPIQYRVAVTNLLEKASSVYLQRIRQLGDGMEAGQDEISELVHDLQKAAVNSNQSLRRVAVGPGDHFFMPSSSEYHNGGESSSLQDEQKEKPVLPSTPSISAHTVLGQILFDACVPKNVEGWDIRFSGSLNGQPIASARRRSPFHGIRSNRRSRL
ncbi:hypothetical protein HS088_TW07G01227 [Tripterygium wilfordii]|uniref:Uncharacterized protein n=1 Tax=Tripterygium wilfordii TaxID=458696 RepID=A0A7J7DGX7_TRIWF|nr:uncharacterized protein LOC120002857 [Tripterygium wilfordii]KAF5745635.1 hypothetical protein HS088_TW07G01227 [Tripterygium wilfordii]